MASNNSGQDLPEESPGENAAHRGDAPSVTSEGLPPGYPWLSRGIVYEDEEDSVIEADVRIALPEDEVPPDPPPLRASGTREEEDMASTQNESKEEEEEEEEDVTEACTRCNLPHCWLWWTVVVATVLGVATGLGLGIGLSRREYSEPAGDLSDDRSTDNPTAAPIVPPTMLPTTLKPVVNTESPVETLAPTHPCEILRNKFYACVQRETTDYGYNFCTGCAARFIERLYVYSCTDFSLSLCTELPSCRCGVCDEIMREFVECGRGKECIEDCENVALSPTIAPDVCTVAQNNYDDCTTKLTQYDFFLCNDCTNKALVGASRESCQAFNLDFCNAFSQCNCQNCTPAVLKWIPACSVEDLNCTISCA